MSVNIYNKKGAEEQLKLTVSTVNSCFSALSSLKDQKSTTLTPLKNAVSVVNFLNIRNQSLPQFFRRQVLVLSAQQIVIGKELDIGLSNLQPQFGIRIVHKKVGSLTNILYLYR